MSNSKRDYYETLNLPKDATKDQIKQQYRKLALQYHPDRNKSPGAEDRFKQISEAYAVLYDDEKRAQYDRFGHAGIDSRYSAEDIFRGVNFDEIFRDIGFGFGGFDSIFESFFGSRRRPRGPARGQDIRYDLEISLEQAYKGLTSEIEVPRTERCNVCGGSGASPGTSPKKCEECDGTGQIQHVQVAGFMQFARVETCRKCRGRGITIDKPCSECRGGGVVERERRISIKVPAGVDTGSQLILRDEGEAPARGERGDLYVVVHVQPHSVFKRDGNDLICQVDVTYSKAALGGEMEVPTLDGPARITLQSGTQSGAIFRLRKKGMPGLRDRGRGDELVIVQINTPNKLTSRQRELIQDLSREGL